jgi:formylglycine-generating enzyme required for sulfatase activity
MRSHLALSLVSLATALALGGCAVIADIQDLPGSGQTPDGADAGTPSSGPLGDGTGPSGNPTGTNPPGSTPPGSTIPTAPSCDSLPATCGADGATSCCASISVPGGSYFRDYDAKDFTNSNLRATVSAFRLDRFEVTLGRFRAFVAAYANGWRPADGSGADPASQGDDGWNGQWWSYQLTKDGMDLEANLECHTTFQTYSRTPGDAETRPINCVSWYVAYAFCVWDGARLPTDAEWNYVAAGGDEQRYYPWNADIDEGRASYFVDSTHQCRGDKVDGCALTDLTGAGTHPTGAGKWGHDDLAGNVAEWVRDGNASTNTNCVDCIDPNDRGGVRRVRGGAFNSAPGAQLRVAAFETADPGTPSERIGIRCARSP